MSERATILISPGAICGDASHSSLPLPRLRSRGAHRGRALRDNCTSARTSICTKCAFPRCGAIRRQRRWANFPRSSCAACCCRMARHCAIVWHAASGHPWRCGPRWIPAGARRRFWWRRWQRRAATTMRHSCCSPGIMTFGTTASWTTAAPTPPCWKFPGCARRSAIGGGAD
jgi:hypothetical protein